MSQMLFLKLDGIEGEAPVGDDKQKAIAIVDYAHSLSNNVAAVRPSTGASVTHRRTPCTHSLFSVTKVMDKTSPKLLAACANSVLFKHAVVYLCSQEFSQLTQSSEAKPFMSIVMSDVIIADFTYAYQDSWQVESLAFRYASIGWKLDWADPEDGEIKKLEPVGWDAELNKSDEIAVPAGLKWKSGLPGL